MKKAWNLDKKNFCTLIIRAFIEHPNRGDKKIFIDCNVLTCDLCQFSNTENFKSVSFGLRITKLLQAGKQAQDLYNAYAVFLFFRKWG